MDFSSLNCIFFYSTRKKQLHTTADQNYVYVNIQLKEKHVEIQLSLLLLNTCKGQHVY